MKIKGEQKTNTFGTIGGIDYDDLDVYWEFQPAEPDVNVQEGVEINRIVVFGKELYDNASENEIDLLAERVLEYAYQLEDDDGGWEPPEPDEAQEWYDFDPDC